MSRKVSLLLSLILFLPAFAFAGMETNGVSVYNLATGGETVFQASAGTGVSLYVRSGGFNSTGGVVQEEDIDWATGTTPTALARLVGYVWTDTSGKVWIGNASGSVSAFWAGPAGSGVTFPSGVSVPGGQGYFADKVGIGTLSPGYKLDVVSQSTADIGTITTRVYSSVAGYSPAIVNLKARGTVAIPAAVQGGDVLGGVFANGYNGGGFFSTNTAGIIIYAAQTFTALSQGSYITFNTTKNDTVSRLERVRIADDGNVGIGTLSPNAKLDVQGLGSFTSGVSTGQSGVTIGPVTPIAGITSFVAFASGVSPTGSMTAGGILYCAGNELWVNDGSGTHTQISPHDPETGEWYHNAFNVYTGDGIKYYPLTGKTVRYSVPRIDPHEVARAEQRAAWVADYVASGAHDEEVAVSDAFIEISEQVEDPASGVTTEKTRYELDHEKGKVRQVVDQVVTLGKKMVTRRALRADCRFDSETGKIWRKPTAAEAEDAAFLNFTYKPRKLPRWIEDYLVLHPIEKVF